jgi:hypothetical protein
MCCRGQLTVNRTKAPEWLVFNPYISAGYRKQLSFFDCAKSVFSLHNGMLFLVVPFPHSVETGNMWTHLLAVFYMMYIIRFGYSRLDGQSEMDKVRNHFVKSLYLEYLLDNWICCLRVLLFQLPVSYLWLLLFSRIRRFAPLRLRWHHHARGFNDRFK